MDVWSSLYSLTGVSEPLYVALEAFISVVLAAGLASIVLEAGRIYREYSIVPAPAARQAPVPPKKPAEKKKAPVTEKPKEKAPAKAPEKAPEKAAVKAPEKIPETPKIDITKLAARPVIPQVDVLKATLKESVAAMQGKYKLDSVTLSSPDGLVIASTSNTPDEDAAVFSGLFQDMYRARPGNYYCVPNKYVHMFLVESLGSRLIGIAKRPGELNADEVSGLQEDSRKILDKFASAGKK